MTSHYGRRGATIATVLATACAGVMLAQSPGWYAQGDFAPARHLVFELTNALEFDRVNVPVAGRAPDAAAAVVWQVDSLERIGGHPVTVLGSPRVVDAPGGRAVEFDGIDDGLVLDSNPLAGLERFTAEVLFEPAPGGPEEQRFLHFEESDTGNRALIELRLLPGAGWCLDTFLRYGQASLTQIDRSLLHPAGRWHAAALSFDGRTMTHYVDGVRELAGDVAFKPLGPGQTSIGVRLNRRSWFKGRIRTVRVTPEVLPADRLLKDGNTP
jgi:hypothetical protein